MSDAQSIALSGLRTEELQINKLAQDLANLNTHNYKTTELIFSDLLYQENQAEKTMFSKTSQGITGSGVSITQSMTNFKQGPLTPSENWNHLAIDGPGFFQVYGLDQEMLYTRNSRLALDQENYLSTAEGLRLSDNIQIPENATQIFIRKNGDVEISLPDEPELKLLGTIQLAKFPHPEYLKAIDSGLYKPNDSTGAALIHNPGNEGMGEILQFQSEGSNVDMLNTLMQLTMAQRIYQLNAKAMQIADEMEKITHDIPN